MEVELTSKNFEQQNVITEGHLVAILTIKFNTPQIFSLNDTLLYGKSLQLYAFTRLQKTVLWTNDAENAKHVGLYTFCKMFYTTEAFKYLQNSQNVFNTL